MMYVITYFYKCIYNTLDNKYNMKYFLDSIYFKLIEHFLKKWKYKC